MTSLREAAKHPGCGACRKIVREAKKRFSAIELKTLRILAKNKHRFLRPNYIGEQLWPKSVKRTSNCSAPFARPAGNVLNRLRIKQAATYEYSPLGGDWGWRITPFGEAQVRR